MSEYENILKFWKTPGDLVSGLTDLARRDVLERLVAAERAVLFERAAADLDTERRALDGDLLELDEKLRQAREALEQAQAEMETARRAADYAKRISDPQERQFALTAGVATTRKMASQNTVGVLTREREEKIKRRATVVQALHLLTRGG